MIIPQTSSTMINVRVLARLLSMAVAVLVWLVGTAQADVQADGQVRVVIVFDAQGHRVEQLYRSVSARPTIPSSIDPASARHKTNSLLPQVHWYASDGGLLTRENIVDPRVMHAPIAGSASAENPVRYVLNNSGVYLITGPAAASRVTISLPPLNTAVIPIPATQWTLDLSDFR